MNSKNILIAIGLFGIGVVLYKLLVGFVLPIALFVALGYVLKFLLKGSDSDTEEEVPKIISNINKNISTANIVEIKAIKDEQAADDEKGSDDEKPAKEDIV
tara:strand:- start:65 stop:367 length:303 start_codon:yes stop_codon:yes gene_type:complete